MSDEISDKTISVAFVTARVSERVIRELMHAYIRRAERNKRHNRQDKTISQGKHTLKSLKEQGGELTSIEITDQNLKGFDRAARKYHVSYAIKKTKDIDPPKYYVFFRAKDVDNMTAAFKEYTASCLKEKDRPSIKEKLHEKSVLAAELLKRAKVKHKKKEMER